MQRLSPSDSFWAGQPETRNHAPISGVFYCRLGCGKPYADPEILGIGSADSWYTKHGCRPSDAGYPTFRLVNNKASPFWIHILDKCVHQFGPREILRYISIGCLANLSQPSDLQRNRQRGKKTGHYGCTWHPPRSAR